MIHVLDISCISPQDTYGDDGLKKDVIFHEGDHYLAVEPDYKDFISKGALRRMGKASRLGIGAGHPIVNKHPNLDGIILSSGNGGLGECVQFLNQIIKYEEGTLTPTHFVNSTANSVAGSLALSTNTTGYNATHVGHGFGFETALIDALMKVKEGNGETFLVGSVDEISEYNSNIERHKGFFKKENTSSKTILKSTSAGTVMGEGSSMFLVSKNPKNKLASILDADVIQTREFEEIKNALLDFLSKNDHTQDSIDTLILGLNGDGIGDQFYHNILEELFLDQTVLTFKNLVGDHPTVSSFALWMACQNGNIPQEAYFRNNNSESKTILIYNHYQNEQHGFILVQKGQ